MVGFSAQSVLFGTSIGRPPPFHDQPQRRIGEKFCHCDWGSMCIKVRQANTVAKDAKTTSVTRLYNAISFMADSYICDTLSCMSVESKDAMY